MAQNDDSKATHDWIYKALEGVPKLGAILLSLFYVTGIIVVSGQYAKYKIRITTLLDSTYITAGFWAMLPILLGAISFVILTKRREKMKKKEATAQARAVIRIFGTIGLLCLVFIGIKIIGASGWLGSPALVILIYLYGIFSMELLASSVMDKAWISSILFSYSLGFYLYIYGYFVHENVDQTLGGGKPQIVQLVSDPRDDIKKAILGSGIAFQDLETSLTEPLFLVTSTEKEYILLQPRSRKVINMNKDLVRIVVSSINHP